MVCCQTKIRSAFFLWSLIPLPLASPTSCFSVCVCLSVCLSVKLPAFLAFFLLIFHSLYLFFYYSFSLLPNVPFLTFPRVCFFPTHSVSSSELLCTPHMIKAHYSLVQIYQWCWLSPPEEHVITSIPPAGANSNRDLINRAIFFPDIGPQFLINWLWS